MHTDLNSFNLPVREIVPAVRQALIENNTLLVNAPPGAGKSTLLPLTFLDLPFLENKKILMLEPRRLAAKAIAYRMADMLGESIGNTIGYRIRFESKISSTTKIEVLTEGILTRMLHHDNALEDVGIVVFDEFHERNIHADVAMALCREVQDVLRPDLRILVMSATLDMPQLQQLLKCPAINSEGKIYPVEKLYTGDFELFSLPETISQVIEQAIIRDSGDLLVFLPGQGEIRKTEALLKKKGLDIAIHPLYGQLSMQAQQQALLPNRKGKRKIVLATSIAETSLTIEGVSIVIDCGYGKTSKFNPRTGLSKLETVKISKDSADQRAGRAGRLGPGICYRMWSKASHLQLAEYRTPEILETDLAYLVLDMFKWGITDIEKLTWLTTPPEGSIMQAITVLEEIQAISQNKLTAHGEKIHALPAHPRIAHMLLEALEIGLGGQGCDIAALLEERDPMPAGTGVDINYRLEALQRMRRENMKWKGFAKIEKVAAHYRKILDILPQNSPIDPMQTGLLIAYAFPERIASARPGNNAQFQLANGKIAMLGHRDDLAHEAWIAVSHIDAREGVGKIFLASPLDPKDLREMVKEKKIIKWDKRSGELLAVKTLGIGSIILKSTPLGTIDQNVSVRVLCDAAREDGENLLDWNENTSQLMLRVNFVRHAYPEKNWPDFSQKSLLRNPETWLAPYLIQVKNETDFFRLNLHQILRGLLNFEQQVELEKLVPIALTVPSGSQIKITYRNPDEAPILAARLQELFGMIETPKINNNKTALLIHLLSPGYKPVQVTADLKNFWSETYFMVKKELKRRYPKHYWPDNPLEAEAVRGVKRKGG